MGKLEQRKNTVRLIEAFAEFARAHREGWKLVLAGKRFWGKDGIDAALRNRDLRGRVVEIGYVSDEDQPLLFSAAEMFVFPTLWEGFGLPILEAMACGTPTVSSNVSCLPEIAGSAAALVNPFSVDEIAAAMSMLACDHAVRADLAARGLERAKGFTWEATAQKTIAVYRKAHAAT